MSDLRKAAQQALEVLETLQGGCTDSDDGTVEAITVWCPAVIDALRAALAEPVQEPEPAGWFEGPFGEFRANPLHRIAWPAQTVAWSIPLYLAPPQRKPLSEEEIASAYAACKYGSVTELARAIERAHEIGGEA